MLNEKGTDGLGIQGPLDKPPVLEIEAQKLSGKTLDVKDVIPVVWVDTGRKMVIIEKHIGTGFTAPGDEREKQHVSSTITIMPGGDLCVTILGIWGADDHPYGGERAYAAKERYLFEITASPGGKKVVRGANIKEVPWDNNTAQEHAYDRLLGPHVIQNRNIDVWGKQFQRTIAPNLQRVDLEFNDADRIDHAQPPDSPDNMRHAGYELGVGLNQLLYTLVGKVDGPGRNPIVREGVEQQLDGLELPEGMTKEKILDALTSFAQRSDSGRDHALLSGYRAAWQKPMFGDKVGHWEPKPPLSQEWLHG